MLQTNEAIVTVEERVNSTVAALLAIVMQGEDTAKGELWLMLYGRALVRLRALQAKHLEAVRQ